MFEKKNPKENHLSAEKALMTENGFGMHFPRIYLKVADSQGSLPHPVLSTLSQNSENFHAKVILLHDLSDLKSNFS
jgi:hypothetical protein